MKRTLLTALLAMSVGMPPALPFTPHRVMTVEVGVITGDLIMETVGGVRTVRYMGSNERYTVAGR